MQRGGIIENPDAPDWEPHPEVNLQVGQRVRISRTLGGLFPFVSGDLGRVHSILHGPDGRPIKTFARIQSDRSPDRAHVLSTSDFELLESHDNSDARDPRLPRRMHPESRRDLLRSLQGDRRSSRSSLVAESSEIYRDGSDLGSSKSDIAVGDLVRFLDPGTRQVHGETGIVAQVSPTTGSVIVRTSSGEDVLALISELEICS